MLYFLLVDRTNNRAYSIQCCVSLSVCLSVTNVLWLNGA